MDTTEAKTLLDLLKKATSDHPTDESVRLRAVDGHKKGIPAHKMQTLLRALALEGAITFDLQSTSPNVPAIKDIYSVHILPGFEAFEQRISDQFFGRVPEKSMVPSKDLLASSISVNDMVSLRFDDINRYILLNDCFLIAQPSYDSENYRFFEYVWNNPNRSITLDELNKQLEEPLKKSLAKILDNLNFKGPLKDAFFQVSKTSVHFTPSRTVEELTQAGLYPLRLFTTQKIDELK